MLAPLQVNVKGAGCHAYESGAVGINRMQANVGANCGLRESSAIESTQRN